MSLKLTSFLYGNGVSMVNIKPYVCYGLRKNALKLEKIQSFADGRHAENSRINTWNTGGLIGSQVLGCGSILPFV